MAHSGRPGRQAEPSATCGCRKPFPDISSPGGIFQAGGFCGLLGVGSGLSPPFSLFRLRMPPQARQMQCCVCQPLLFTSQKWQPELAPSRPHESPSIQTHDKKPEEELHLCFWVLECSLIFHPTKPNILAACRLTILSLRGDTRVQSV